MIRSRSVAEGTFAAILLAAGVALFIFAPDLVRGWAFAIPGTTDVALEPAFFPRLASAALALAALAVVLTIPFRHDELPIMQLSPRHLGNVALGLVGIVAYLLSIDLLGFVVSSSIFMTVATWLGGYRRLLILVPTAVIVAVLLRFVFRFGLHVGLPTGFFF